MFEEPEVLYRRDELCIVETSGVVVGMSLAPIQSTWLPAILEAQMRAAERRGGAAPLLSIFRLDDRFPVRVGFDSNLEDLRRARQVVARTMNANALVIEFEGIIGRTLRAMLGALGTLASQSPPTAVHSSVIEGIRWLERVSPDAEGRPYRLAHTLHAVRRARALLGVDEG